MRREAGVDLPGLQSDGQSGGALLDHEETDSLMAGLGRGVGLGYCETHVRGGYRMLVAMDILGETRCTVAWDADLQSICL